jgi:hypothetical protein
LFLERVSCRRLLAILAWPAVWLINVRCDGHVGRICSGDLIVQDLLLAAQNLGLVEERYA